MIATPTTPMNAEQMLLQVFLQVVIAVATPILTAILIDLGRQAKEYVRSRMTAKQMEFVDDVVRRYVRAAEQYNLAGLIQMVGAEKKAWVIEQASKELARHNVYLDLNVLADIAEAAVLEEITKPELDRKAINGDLADAARLN